MVEGYAGAQVPRDSFASASGVRAQCQRASTEGQAGLLSLLHLSSALDILCIIDMCSMCFMWLFYLGLDKGTLRCYTSIYDAIIPNQTRNAKEQFLKQGPGSLAMDKEEEVDGDHDGGDGQEGDVDGDDHRCLWYALNKDTSDILLCQLT